ncbi:histidine phosphatase superfamily [Lineolata rhizophorae]|uniref:Histidine phosphatase superfamily n=1 Tax=Lineolata rhizophorae TaxID=578093 RepID=A0A6A6P477_9PEZI|nr:histidine phosphatase superfamily [Lineolata rhizophorae]
MGKPRMIILVRHAQSEGNKNRDIHQFIPDHRVKLTADGHAQAEEAGRRLRSLLKPDDTLQFYTSPYRRTRETTEGMLRSLTSDDPTPSPWPRHTIKVYEEPRLREQDFGNFQPCSAEMERMWQERADYGHFFYRIPNGESAADAYDRVSGFNESMWRQFGEAEFPSVCVLVTHGLMTRVFLMKWYHWSVEYFEDLRNVNHCEFIVMKQNPDNGKYILQNELRTWSDLKKRAAAQAAAKNAAAIKDGNSPPKQQQTSAALTSSKPAAGAETPGVPARRWGSSVVPLPPPSPPPPSGSKPKI